MKNFTKLISLVLSGYVLTGCVTTSSPEGDFSNRVNLAGANQLFSKNFESFDDERLLYLIDPVHNGEEVKSETNSNIRKNLAKKNNTIKTASQKELEKKIRMAFYNANNTPGSYGKGHRSQIQDRLIAASNQRCNLYKVYLKRLSTEQNSIFGTLTTILAGAGSIVTNTNAARTLSGLAGIASGTRAELNQAIFESVTTSIIIPGIENRRNTLLDQIMKKRVQELQIYTVEAAIADVIKYNGACSLDAGIANAQRQIQSYDEYEEKIEKTKSSDILPNSSNPLNVNNNISLEANNQKVVSNLSQLLKDEENFVKNRNMPELTILSNNINANLNKFISDARKYDEELIKKYNVFNNETDGSKKSSLAIELQILKLKSKDLKRQVTNYKQKFRDMLHKYK